MGSHQGRIMFAIVAIPLLLAACSDVRQDHAACKLKALELYKSKMLSSSGRQPEENYVVICMTAAGYHLKAICSGPSRWTEDDCYYRKTFW